MTGEKPDVEERMGTICGADCTACPFKAACKGCEKTCGRPFGGACVAAEYIKAHGKKEYAAFKGKLLGEINAVLREEGLPPAEALYELPGSVVNFAYPAPDGGTVKYLDDTKVYLGAQASLGDGRGYCGAAADGEVILVCRYGAEGSDPSLVAFKKR